MPRPPRIHVPGAYYHVTARGNHRQDIFFQPADRRILDDCIAAALERTGSRMHAYCYMTNHVHFLIQIADAPLGEFMQRVASRYARAVQKRIPTTGHLFENRYHALLVDADTYLLVLLRYIHLNPVRAKLVTSLEHYRWSSHRAYLGSRSPGWVYSDFGLTLFDADPARARQAYSRFVAQGIGAPSDPGLHTGNSTEPRVLGDDRFLASLGISVTRTGTASTLPQIAATVCTELGVTLEHLRSPRQNRRLSQARGLITARAVDQRAATLSDIARFLNRERSTLARAAQRYGR